MSTTNNAAQVEQYFRDALEFFASDRCGGVFQQLPEQLAVAIAGYVTARAQLDAADRQVFFGSAGAS